MSLVTYPNSNNPNASGCASKKRCEQHRRRTDSRRPFAQVSQPLDVFA